MAVMVRNLLSVSRMNRRLLTKVCSAGAGGSVDGGINGAGSMGGSCCRFWPVLKPAETGEGDAERARNDNNNLAVTRPVEVHVAPAFLLLENMSAVAQIDCRPLITRREINMEMIDSTCWVVNSIEEAKPRKVSVVERRSPRESRASVADDDDAGTTLAWLPVAENATSTVSWALSYQPTKRIETHFQGT